MIYELRTGLKIDRLGTGKKIGDFRKKWNKACQAAGLTGVIVHDMRRSAARNLSLLGVKEQLALKSTGHKANSMYRRYRVVADDELKATPSPTAGLFTKSD